MLPPLAALTLFWGLNADIDVNLKKPLLVTENRTLAKIIMVSEFDIAVPIMNHSTMKELRHAKVINFGPVAENDPQNVIDLDLVAENAKVIDHHEQIKNEKQKFCMCLVNTKADTC